MTYYVESGKVSSGVILNADSMCVLSGGTALGTIVNEGGYLDVASSGSASGAAVLDNGGSMLADIGARAEDVRILGGKLKIYGFVDSAEVLSGGVIEVLENGLADHVSVGSGGLLEVSEWGSASNIVWTPCVGRVESHAGAHVAFADSYSGTYYGSGDVLLSHTGTMSGMTLEKGASAVVMFGGTIDSFTIRDGGEAAIYSGGSADGVSVSSGGLLTVLDGGVATNVSWTPCVGDVQIQNGAAVTFTSVFAGVYFGSDGTLLSSAALLSGVTAGHNARAYVFQGGTADAITVWDGGRMDVTGGTANSAFITEDGEFHVESGGIANAAIVRQTGEFIIENGGTANSTVMEQGGYIKINNGGIASGTVVTDDGRVEICEGGSAIGTLISGSAGVAVSNGGAAVSTTVQEKGVLGVGQGGVAYGTIVNSYGEVHVLGGTVNATQLTSGSLDVSSGVADGTVIDDFGFVTVFGGAAASDTTVNAGGIFKVYEGGKVEGNLQISSGAEVVVSAGGEIDFDLTKRKTEEASFINDLSLVGGNPDFTVTVSSGTQGTYKLADGAKDFTGSVTVALTGDPGGVIIIVVEPDAPPAEKTILGTVSVGGTLSAGGKTYALSLTDGLLSFTVSGSAKAAGDDLNGDGRADVILSLTQSGHEAEGATGAWLIQEDQTPVWGNLSQRNSGWEIFGTGFTAAGKRSADVYVRNTDNVIGAWTTDDSGNVTGWETVGEFDANTQILGLGDFNGDGQTDLLLRNVNGAVGCFATNGESVGWNYFESLGGEWQIAAIGDFNGDGKDDVILKHDAGFAGSWLIQDDYRMTWANLDTLPDGYEIVGAGDFNGDGADDVLLRNGTYYGAWLVRDGSVDSWMGFGDLGGITVEQIADFDGDGKDDLRIRTSSGDLGALLVRGADDLEWKYYGSVGKEWGTALAAV